MDRTRWSLAAVAIVSMVISAFAQASSPLEFDVASIKPNTSGSTSSSGRAIPGGEVMLTNALPVSMVSVAYPPGPGGRVIGMPSWASNQRYDVIVEASPGTTREQQTMMWRTLLADRMKLVAHYETREEPGYDLVLAHSDGHFGPQLKPSTVDCVRGRNSAAAASSAPAEPLSTDQVLWTCAAVTMTNAIYAGSIPMASLAGMLTRLAGRFVSDRTGLEGRYSVVLKFSRGLNTSSAGGSDDLPSIFTAVEEQLGLKLQSSRAQVQVVVIDHIERPSEN